MYVLGLRAEATWSRFVAERHRNQFSLVLFKCSIYQVLYGTWDITADLHVDDLVPLACSGNALEVPAKHRAEIDSEGCLLTAHEQ